MNATRYNLPVTKDNTTAREAARLASEIIIEEYEDVLIEEYIKQNYSFLEPGERLNACRMAKRAARLDLCESVPPRAERKAAVATAVERYLEKEDFVIPAGFARFRLRQLQDYAADLADKGADMFFEEKEYEEFTYLLRLFIEEKESSEEILHIVWTGDDVKLFNKRRRDVTEKYEREFYAAAARRGIGREDLAISAVISAAPKRLVFHNAPESSPLKETLLKIFEGKCSLCNGCDICKKH